MDAPSFEDRVAERLPQMSPAEQRVVRYFRDNREEVLMTSAAVLAAKAETSDATVVRATKALGFKGLDELRRSLADEIRRSPSPAERLTRTLGELDGGISNAFGLVLDIHLRSLEGVRRAISPTLFETAVGGIAAAKRIVVFGLGPSGAIADYLSIQLGRFGLEAISLKSAGVLFADDLHRLRADDLVIMMAYGRLYAELAALLDEISRRGLRAFLVTDTLAVTLRQRVELVLPVARGRADMLSMHTATLGLIEALLVGVAATRPDETLAALKALNDARERLAGKRLALPR
jgi:DNA-binding MurR/RpiR family transcriptional regulator